MAVELNEVKHHEVFRLFKRWEGIVEEGMLRNFLGVVTRTSFFNLIRGSQGHSFVSTDYPLFNEEYFEWIDLLESVVTAQNKFTMIELGAGWGRWLVCAAKALNQIKELPCMLIGVEAEPEHYQWMKLHFTDNGLDPESHELIEAAVSDQEGSVKFYVGRADEWYGQAIASDDTSISSSVMKVPAVSLKTLLQPLDLVDLIDLDVQGAELMVLRAAAKELNRKVKRVHIGTHNFAVEAGLRDLFGKLGWKCLNDYPCGSQSETPYGVIKFEDGVQTWLNPNMVSNHLDTGDEQIYADTSAFDRAIHKYISSPLPDFLNSLAESKFNDGDKEDAKLIFLEIVRQWPSYHTAYNNLAVIAWEAGDKQNALRYFAKALKIAPYDKSTVLNCGNILVFLGKIEEARKLYLSYLQKNPNDEEVSSMLINIKD